MSSQDILSQIKSNVLRVLPGAKVCLFGSRAYGVPHEESDWDILILSRQPVTAVVKKRVHDVLFPVRVNIGAFINTLMVEETEWNTNPSYCTIQQTVKGGMVVI